mmetsp:Transcript_17974/g.51847  ORF Transcript_17974/g.51847 Transcript_17974/m.51847 type:complete len:341 (+) Transcript_17974:57-1079(+)
MRAAEGDQAGFAPRLDRKEPGKADAEEHAPMVDEGPSAVGDILGRSCVVRLPGSTMTDAAELLLAENRTAAAVVDERGEVVGALTENDILQAFAIGLPKGYQVEAWLHGEFARLPNFVAQALTVDSKSSLQDAASLMRAQASGDFACHHLLVKDGAKARGILSALDLTRALCQGIRRRHSDFARRFTYKTTADVMKPRASLPICEHAATMCQVAQEMLLARQNCVLVAAADGVAELAHISGMVTPRDILRAFAAQTPGSTSAVEWLQGLDSYWELRAVRCDALLGQAADIMSANGVHHLVVVAPPASPAVRDVERIRVVGIVSSTDLAYNIGAKEDDQKQ